MIIQTVYRALLINNTYTKMKKKRTKKKKGKGNSTAYHGEEEGARLR